VSFSLRESGIQVRVIEIQSGFHRCERGARRLDLLPELLSRVPPHSMARLNQSLDEQQGRVDVAREREGGDDEIYH
jgi:hypothetical protein